MKLESFLQFSLNVRKHSSLFWLNPIGCVGNTHFPLLLRRCPMLGEFRIFVGRWEVFADGVLGALAEVLFCGDLLGWAGELQPWCWHLLLRWLLQWVRLSQCAGELQAWCWHLLLWKLPNDQLAILQHLLFTLCQF